MQGQVPLSMPIEIAIIGVLTIAVGLVTLGTGAVMTSTSFRLFFLEQVASSSFIFAVTGLLMGFGLFVSIIGFGLTTGKKWAWNVMVGYLFFEIAINLLELYNMKVTTYEILWYYWFAEEIVRPVTLVRPAVNDLITIVTTTAIYSLVIYLLYKPHVRRYFEKQKVILTPGR